MEEGVALFRELRARGDVALGLYNLGWIALLQDDIGKAADLYRESLSLSWEIGLNPLVQWALEGLALAASYSPVHSEWYEDPDAVQPGEVLTHAASPEDIRRAYRRYGARFEVDAEGTLTLRLSLGLDGGALHPELSPR